MDVRDHHSCYRLTRSHGFRWDRGESGNNGYGITSVLEGGDVLEKAAANISVIKGTLTPERAQAMSSRGRDNIDPEGGQPYSAVAMSLVFHSAHPFIPTLRADVRLFEVPPPTSPSPPALTPHKTSACSCGAACLPILSLRCGRTIPAVPKSSVR